MFIIFFHMAETVFVPGQPTENRSSFSKQLIEIKKITWEINTNISECLMTQKTHK